MLHRSTRSIWSILLLVANSRVRFRAEETSLYCFPDSMELIAFEKSVSFSGTVAANSARSITDRVVCCPGQRLAQTLTKSSAICFPISVVAMEVFEPSLVSQSV